MKISDAEKVNRMDPLDMLPIVTENGFRSIFAEDLAKSVFLVMANEDDDSENADLAKEIYFEFLDGFADVEIRRNTFRGKLLGTEVTAEQYAHIADGSFKGFFCGDYWRINGYTWRIADFDYWFSTYNDDPGVGFPIIDHHLLIFPDEGLFRNNLRNEVDTTGGFLGTKYFSNAETNRPLCKVVEEDYLYPAFESVHILEIYDVVTNNVSNGNPISGAWTRMNSILPNEVMIFGSYFWTAMSSNNLNAYNITSSRFQLALLRINPVFINEGYEYWEQGIVMNGVIPYVTNTGRPSSHNANNNIPYIRPIFGLK